MKNALTMSNGSSVPLSNVPDLSMSEFRESILTITEKGGYISALFGFPSSLDIQLIAVLACKDKGRLSVLSTHVKESYPSLTPECPQAHMFEREIFEQWNIEPKGHPWLKPVRFESSRQMQDRKDESFDEHAICGVTEFFQVEGAEVHEVAVGPIHAGIIEPGHFRFQCHGENVQHLEISLGYQHRGIERALIGAPDKRTIHLIETMAGDTSIGHTLAYCRNVESMAGMVISGKAQVIRGIALELERMANHIGDLGAMAGDIGFLPTLSYCGRIRGELLNLTALLCGNRFGRGLIRPGGVNFDVDADIAQDMQNKLKQIMRDAESAVQLLWNSSSVLARFESTGAISTETARSIGLVGVAARASGLKQDVRHDFPCGIYQMTHIPVSTWVDGDVMSRALVRWQEVGHSAQFIEDQLNSLPDGVIIVKGKNMPKKAHLAVSLVEGWRGEICHAAVTRDNASYQCYKVVDPSFHNWFGLALALRDQQISDFPVCNKSFNLSYCGHDL